VDAARPADDDEAADGARSSVGAGRTGADRDSDRCAREAQRTKETFGEFETECPGYCGAQDTFYVGTLKGVGRIYQQTFIDTYSKVAFAKVYTEKTPITAADSLNDRVLPFFADHAIPLSRMLTDRGSEYCGAPDRHPYELYLTIEDVRAHPDENETAANERHLRAFSQDPTQ